MFPIRDDNPHFTTPYATYGLIGANVLAWILLQGLGTEPALSASVFGLGFVPGDVLGGAGGWHTVLTSMFLHGGWMHLIGNMWFLWIFGNNVEDAMGHLRFVAFYLLCGVAAALLQAAFDPGSAIPMVGASGAIGGVMGAYVMMYPRVHVHLLIVFGFVTTVAVPAIFMLGYWFLLQVVSGTMAAGAQGGGVAFWAHVGGFVAGVVLSFVFRDREMLARHPYHGWNQRGSPTQNWHRVRR